MAKNIAVQVGTWSCRYCCHLQLLQTSSKAKVYAKSCHCQWNVDGHRFNHTRVRRFVWNVGPATCKCGQNACSHQDNLLGIRCCTERKGLELEATELVRLSRNTENNKKACGVSVSAFVCLFVRNIICVRSCFFYYVLTDINIILFSLMQVGPLQFTAARPFRKPPCTCLTHLIFKNKQAQYPENIIITLKLF